MTNYARNKMAPEYEEDMYREDGSRMSRDERILLGLAILATKPMPPGGFSEEVIAAYCGCRKANIWQTKVKALRKVKRKLDGNLSKIVGEIMEWSFARNGEARTAAKARQIYRTD